MQDRTRTFQAALSDLLSSFSLRQESEIMRIPKDLRNIKMGQLKEMWGGDWAATLRILKERTLHGEEVVSGRAGGVTVGAKMEEAEKMVEDRKKRCGYMTWSNEENLLRFRVT